MQERSLLAAMLFATLALAISATSATALRALVMNAATRSSRLITSGTITLTAGAEVTAACSSGLTWRITPGGSISKAAGSSIGEIQSFSASCTGANVRITTAPTAIRYESFTGTLPNIREVRLRLSSLTVLIEVPARFLACQYAGEPRIISNGNPYTSHSFDATATLPLERNLFIARCPESVAITGREAIGATETIRIGLV